MTLPISIGLTCHSSRVVRVDFEDFAAFADWLDSVRGDGPDKLAAAYFTPATMRHDRRAKDNAEDAHVVALDFDQLERGDGRRLVDAIETAGWRCATWTTASHRDDAPRMRMVAELSRPVTRSEFQAVYTGAARLVLEKAGIERPVDAAAAKPEQPALGPRVGGFFRAWTDGSPLDVEALIVYAPQPEPEQPRPAGNGTSKIGEGHRHKALKTIAASLRRKGLSGPVLEAALLAWNDEHCEPPQDRAEVVRLAQDFSTKDGDSLAPPQPERPFLLLPIAELLQVKAPPEYVVGGLIEKGSRVGFVAPPESAKSLLAQHLSACVGTGRSFHHRQVRQGLAVYLFGEGQHGAARRFQALESHYGLGLADAALVVSKVATSLLDPLEVARVRDAIRAAEDRFGLPLTLLVVDTVARFIAPGDESKAQDMGGYIAAVDDLAGDSAAISCHHPGHGDSTRGRGSSSWKAALDTEYTLSATDTPTGRVVTVTCQKMKDGPKPEPFSFLLTQAPTLAEHPDGSVVQSVVLVPTDVTPTRQAPTGKNQKLLLAELERLAAEPGDVGIWTEGDLRRIARGIGMHKNSARDAVLGLRQLGYLTATVGGSRLTTAPEEGPKDRNRTESTISAPAKGPKTGPKAHGSLEPCFRPVRSVPDQEEEQVA